MSQIFNLNTFTRYSILYRGGYDFEKQKGLDPYNRMREYLNVSWYGSWNETVASGMLLSYSFMPDTPTETIKEFFGFTGNKYEYFAECNLKCVFDKYGHIILYKNTDEDPVRCDKIVKNHTKHYKLITGDKYGCEKCPVEYSYWKFKKNVKFLRFSIDYRMLYRLLPVEYNDNKIWTWESTKNYKDILSILYSWDPIDLNDSWDYTDEQKKEIKEAFDQLIEMRREGERQLEILKNTPGHCSQCGAPNADYVDDPFDCEIYGEHNKRWLCPDCYHDIAMDV